MILVKTEVESRESASVEKVQVECYVHETVLVYENQYQRCLATRE